MVPRFNFNRTCTMPTSSLMVSLRFLWKVSRSQSWAVSADVVRAYLPEVCTDMLCMAVSWPFIHATISLVSVTKHWYEIFYAYSVLQSSRSEA